MFWKLCQKYHALQFLLKQTPDPKSMLHQFLHAEHGLAIAPELGCSDFIHVDTLHGSPSHIDGFCLEKEAVMHSFDLLTFMQNRKQI